MGKVIKREPATLKRETNAKGARALQERRRRVKQPNPGTSSSTEVDTEWPLKRYPLPKFRKRSPEEIERAVAEHKAIVAEFAKMNIPPFDAVEDMRKMRDRE